MSKIRLHGSSSGYTEIAPVAASGNNTLTLPNDGTIISQDSNGAVGVTSITVGTGVTIGDGKITCDGSALTSINAANLVGVCTSGLTKTGGFGKILQVVSASKTSAVSSNSTTYYSIGLNATITPTSTSSKILVLMDLAYGGMQNMYGYGKIVRTPSGGSATDIALIKLILLSVTLLNRPFKNDIVIGLSSSISPKHSILTETTDSFIN